MYILQKSVKTFPDPTVQTSEQTDRQTDIIRYNLPNVLCIPIIYRRFLFDLFMFFINEYKYMYVMVTSEVRVPGTKKKIPYYSVSLYYVLIACWPISLGANTKYYMNRSFYQLQVFCRRQCEFYHLKSTYLAILGFTDT